MPLLSNARKQRPAGTKVFSRVGTSPEGAAIVRVTVTEGDGIPQEFVDGCFRGAPAQTRPEKVSGTRQALLRGGRHQWTWFVPSAINS